MSPTNRECQEVEVAEDNYLKATLLNSRNSMRCTTRIAHPSLAACHSASD